MALLHCKLFILSVRWIWKDYLDRTTLHAVVSLLRSSLPNFMIRSYFNLNVNKFLKLCVTICFQEAYFFLFSHIYFICDKFISLVFHMALLHCKLCVCSARGWIWRDHLDRLTMYATVPLLRSNISNFPDNKIFEIMSINS